LQKDEARFLTILCLETGGIAEQERQFLSVQDECCLKPALSSTILGLLLTSLSTKGPFPLLFLFGAEGGTWLDNSSISSLELSNSANLQGGAWFTEQESGMRKEIVFSLLSLSKRIFHRAELRNFFVQLNFSGVSHIRVMKLNQLTGISKVFCLFSSESF
jgi:hypothetical protein